MSDDLPALPTGCSLRGGVYQLRVGIPDDIRHTYPRTRAGTMPTDAFRGSLKTSDRNTAIRLAHAKIAEIQGEFEARRAKLKPVTIQPTAALTKLVAEALHHQILHDDDLNRASSRPLAHIPEEFLQILEVPEVLPADPFERRELVARATYEYAEGLAEAMSIGNATMALGYAGMVERSLGLPTIDWTAEPTMLARINRTLVQSYREVAARNKGEVVETPMVPELGSVSLPSSSPTNGSALGSTLRDVVPEWKARNRPKPNAEQRTEKALKLFEQAVGVVPLSKLDRSVGARFVVFLLDKEARGFGDSTAHNHASCINALANVAQRIGLIERNPFDLTFDVRDAESREPWTEAELQAIYGSPLFTEAPHLFQIIRATSSTDAYFGLLILLFTGLRIGEVAQLEIADLQQREGIEAMEIHGRAGTVKGRLARWVPIAPELIRLGLLEYRDQLAKAGETKLFPSFYRGETSPGDVFGRWFRQYRELRGLSPGALEGSHRFRHTVRTKLAELHIGPDVGDALTGHAATGSTGQRIYTKVGLKATAEAQARLTYSFPLPRVWRAVAA